MLCSHTADMNNLEMMYVQVYTKATIFAISADTLPTYSNH